MPNRQSTDAVLTLPPSCRLSALRRRHGRLRQMRTENPRHRSHISSLISTRTAAGNGRLCRLRSLTSLGVNTSEMFARAVHTSLLQKITHDTSSCRVMMLSGVAKKRDLDDSLSLMPHAHADEAEQTVTVLSIVNISVSTLNLSRHVCS